MNSYENPENSWFLFINNNDEKNIYPIIYVEPSLYNKEDNYEKQLILEIIKLIEKGLEFSKKKNLDKVHFKINMKNYKPHNNDLKFLKGLSKILKIRYIDIIYKLEIYSVPKIVMGLWKSIKLLMDKDTIERLTLTIDDI